MCNDERRGLEDEDEEVEIQLLSSSSVAVSTSQDFDDNATITAFWKEEGGGGGGERIQTLFRFMQQKQKLRHAYFFKAHGTEFVYFACVLRTGNRSACINMRPQPRRLFEHLLVLLVLC